MIMDIQGLKNQELLLFEGISGSKAYGLDTAVSDTDIKGVFILPEERLLGLQEHKIDQVNDESNDQMYYEVGKLIELLVKNNPNMLELIATPPDCILFQDPLYMRLKPSYFLSKKCKQTFAGYAMTQIKKAKGLNKKIVNPVAKERKSVLAFCHVAMGQGSMSLVAFLKKKDWLQEQCGLAKIPHMHGMYALFYDEEGHSKFKGIVQSERANDISLSSIPKGRSPSAIMSFNQSGYSKYCKEYKEYWEWVEKRNEARYQHTQMHGKNYDAKNMMHVFRLLEMAYEIGQTGEIRIRRPNREALLRIKRGEFTYETLVENAEKLLAEIEQVFKQSCLPEEPDVARANRILIDIRREWYARRKANPSV